MFSIGGSKGVILGACLLASGLLVGFTNVGPFSKAFEYPKQLFFNGEPKSSIAMYQIDGQAYVPLRSFAEEMGASVFYSENGIEFNDVANNEVWASHHSSTEFNDFRLQLHSEKKIYDQDDLIRVWSSISYMGEDPIHITHGYPLLIYTMTDASGLKVGGYSTAQKMSKHVEKGNEVVSSLPFHSIREYNYLRSGRHDYQTFLETTTTNPAKLPKGTYTISIAVDFGVSGEKRVKGSTEVTIEVH